MAWTAPRTWSPGETVTASLMNSHLRDNLNTLAVPAQKITKGGNIINPYGITATGEWMAWLVPFACSAVKLSARRVGGGASSTKVNARKNFTSNLLATALDLAAAATEYESTTLQNESFDPGDWFEVMITEIAGSPTQVFIEVEFNAVNP